MANKPNQNPEPPKADTNKPSDAPPGALVQKPASDAKPRNVIRPPKKEDVVQGVQRERR